MQIATVSHPEVKSRLARRENVPTLPAIFTQLVRATSDPDTSLHELATIITYDPALMASVLRVANSSFMALKEPVQDLPSAVLCLGMVEIRRAVLAVGSFKMLFGGRTQAAYLKDIWIHSVATAFISQQLAIVGRFEIEEEAYVAGLMHDLGKLFFASAYPKVYADLRERVADGEGEGLVLEKETFGLNHVEVAAELGTHYKLPPSVIEVGLHHHDPLKAGDAARMLVLCIAIANIMAHHILVDEPVQDRLVQLRTWLLELSTKSGNPVFAELEEVSPQMTLEAISPLLALRADEILDYTEMITSST